MARNTTFGIALRQFVALGETGAQADSSDLTLVDRFTKERDESAFATLLRRHGPMVFGVGRRVLRHTEDAEDVFQAAFLLLARKAGSIRKGESVGSWLHGVTFHLAIRMAAQRSGRKRHENEAAVMHSSQRVCDSSFPELEKALDEALQQLPEIYRQALIVCCLEGKRQEDAARILGCPLATLRSRLARGRQRLHAILIRKGMTLSAGALTTALASDAADATQMLPLLRSTLEASLQFASGKGAETIVSATVASLVDGGLKALFAAKIKMGIAVLACLGVLAGSAGALGSWVLANPSAKVAGGPLPAPNLRAQPTPKNELTDIFGDSLPQGAVKRIGTVRFRHGQHIESVAYSPDGKWIASGSDDNTVRIWDRATGKEIRRFEGHSDDVHFLTFTPDGKYIISSSGLHTLGGSAQRDPCTLKWEAATGKIVLRFPANQWNREMAALALSSDGTTLAACLSPKLYIFDVGSGLLLHTYAADDGIVMKMRFSTDNRSLAMIGDGEGVKLIDAASGKQHWLNEDLKKNSSTFEPTVYGLAFAPDGHRLAVSISRDDPVRILDASNGKEVCRLEGGSGALVFSQDGRRLYSSIGIWDATTGRKVTSLDPKPFWTYDLALSPDGKQLVDAGSGVLLFWDATTGKKISEPAVPLGSVNQIVIAPDGSRIATSSMFDPDAGVRLWDLRNCRQLAALPGSMQNPLAFSPALDSLAYGKYGKGGVNRADMGTWTARETLPGIEANLRTLTFTRDGQKLIGTTDGNPGEKHSIFDGGPILMWDVNSGKKPTMLGSLSISKGAGARCAAVSPDDRFFATGGWDGTIRQWDIAGKKEVRRCVGQGGCICSVCFAPDGKSLTAVSGTLNGKTRSGLSSRGMDHALRIWDVATGHVVRTIDGPVEGSWSVAWSPDGRTIASGGEDGLVRLWEAATARQRACLTGHNGPVTSVAFTPDGKQLLSGSSDTTVLIWDLAKLGSTGGRPRPNELPRLWEELTSVDATRAFQAMQLLASSREQCVSLMKKELRPPTPVDPRKLGEFCLQLDNGVFAIRENASKQLQEQGEPARAALLDFLKKDHPPEARRRAEKLVKMSKSNELPAEERRVVRAVELLERIGNAEAVQLLERLAQGGPGSRLSQEATSAYQRLARVKPESGKAGP